MLTYHPGKMEECRKPDPNDPNDPKQLIPDLLDSGYFMAEIGKKEVNYGEIVVPRDPDGNISFDGLSNTNITICKLGLMYEM